jgi:Tfp pilus assembly protein PilF
MMKVVSETSRPKWWEWVVVGVIFAAAIACARATEPVRGESNSSSQPKSLQAIARFYMSGGDYAKAEKFANKAIDTALRSQQADEDTSACLIDLAWIYKN